MNPSRPSLDFNWLPMSVRKGISTPRLLYIDEQHHYGGMYYFSMPYHYIIQEPDIDLDLDLYEGGVVVVAGENGAAHTLAHEYRHHWQRETGRLNEGSQFDAGSDYETSIRRFFTADPHERDALMFQHRLAPDDLSEYWMQILYAGKRAP